MTESNKSSWDQERVVEILTRLQNEDTEYFQAGNKLVELLGSVREEAIDWTWTHACSQRDRGMDHHKQPRSELLKMANADLNPERE